VRLVIPGTPATYHKLLSNRPLSNGRMAIRVRDEPAYRKWRDYARGMAATYVNEHKLPLMEDAVTVSIRVYSALPLSASKKRRERMLSGIERPLRQDCDNLAKAVNDACLTGIVLRDDRQIVRLWVDKWFDERPRVEVEVHPWVGMRDEAGRLPQEAAVQASLFGRRTED